MIALTSIAPRHYHEGVQQECVKSWIRHGFKVFSFNSYSEAEKLREEYPEVTFITTHRTFEHRFGKPYVAVNALLDWAKEQEDEHILILNSDIFIEVNTPLFFETIFKQSDFSFTHRRDVQEINPVSSESNIMSWGIDVFLLNKKILNIFPQTSLAIGMTHWDYWLPYTASKKGIKPVEIQIPFAYHKIHPQQWGHQIWMGMGQHCMWLTEYEGIRVKPKEYLVKKDIQAHDAMMLKSFKK